MKKHRLWLLAVLLIMAVAGTIASRAQDTKALRPPKGAKVAIVVFEDMQCPDCARAHPLVEEAARTYKIPVVRYDFPLPQHEWSMEAAVIARYFEKKSKKLGHDFRTEVFKHQQEITKQNLRPFAEKFAAARKVDLPVFVDPQGKLAAEIIAERDFGQRIGITHTPTLYVVSNRTSGTPFVEVVDRSNLFQLIDEMKREAR
ncbi:MAG TPA: thioredoxin domain-containing protein [Terriglobales bacterium]|nr:thioredoxin domain-containing protein [Terriglobales bacterium]